MTISHWERALCTAEEAVRIHYPRCSKCTCGFICFLWSFPSSVEIQRLAFPLFLALRHLVTFLDQSKMVKVPSARQCSVCVYNLYMLLGSIKAATFPGSDRMQTLLERSRNIETIRKSILLKIGRPPTDLISSTVPKPLNETFPEIPSKSENKYISEVEEIIAFSEPIGK